MNEIFVKVLQKVIKKIRWVCVSLLGSKYKYDDNKIQFNSDVYLQMTTALLVLNLLCVVKPYEPNAHVSESYISYWLYDDH